MQQGKHQEYEKKLHEQLLCVSRERKSVQSMAVTSSIANCKNMNSSATSCPTCVDSSVKEVWPTRHTGVTTVGHYNESSVSSSGNSKGDNSHRRHKMYHQPSNLETSEEVTKRKEECQNKLTQDGQKSKQIPKLPNAKSHSELVSDKPSSSEHMNKAVKNTDLEVLESEDNLKSRENVGTKLGSNGEKQLGCGRGHLGDRRAPLDDNSFFSTSSIVTGGATNVQSVLPLEDWQNGFQLTGSSNSTDVQDWGYNSSSIPSGSQLVAGSSRLHSITKNDEGGCDITNQNQNSSYVKENLFKSLNRSEIAETFSVDGLMGVRPEDDDNASVTNIAQESEKPPITTNISGVSHPHTFVHYDPAILMINQFSGGNNGAQLLFMNGQPSQTTKRFLEDVQIAQQHKECQLQHLQSHCDHAAGEILNMKSKFNASSRCNPRMTAENVEGTIMNGFQNSNDKVENIKGKHPPGFLYHQHKNKDEDVKYIDSIINPIMSAVQITDNRRAADDELGFDPFHETQKALAEIMEKESMMQHRLCNQHNSFSRVPEHFNFDHQRAMDEYHPVDLFNNRQQHILPQQNHRLPPNVTGCTKLRDGLEHNRGTSAGPSLPRRTRLPPPGFASTSNHIQAYGIPQSRSDAGL